jgi:hypothetical protein
MPDAEKEKLKKKITDAKTTLQAAEKERDAGKTVDTWQVISKTIGILG